MPGADTRGAWACFAASAPFWTRPRRSGTPGTLLSSNKTVRSSGCVDDLARRKGVHRDNDRLRRHNDGLQRQNDRLQRENEHLKQQLATERRAGTPASRTFCQEAAAGSRQTSRPPAWYALWPARGAARARRTSTRRWWRRCRRGVRTAGGTVDVTGAAEQYQEDLPPVRPLVRRFDIEVGHCSQCRRRIQGRHPLQTSDALGAARAQLGPRCGRAGRRVAHARRPAVGQSRRPAADPLRPAGDAGRPRASAASCGPRRAAGL